MRGRWTRSFGKLHAMPAALLALLLCVPAASAPKDPVMDALQTELARSYKALSKDDPKNPLYHLAYQAVELRTRTLASVLGSILHDSSDARRSLDVDARVGGLRLDNTHQIKGAESAGHLDASAAGDLPLDDDSLALRQAAWVLTDRAYKEAQGRYTKVAADKAVTAGDADGSDDFTMAAPHRYAEEPAPPPADLAPWRPALKRLSAAAGRHPFVVSSQVTLNSESRRSWYLDSEGASVAQSASSVRLDMTVAGRTADGMALDRSRGWEARDLASLPSEAEAGAALARLADELDSLLKAPDAEPYHGPAVFRSTAAAVFFHEILGHRLEGHRQKLESEGQTFAKMLGEPVTAPFLSVYDDPALASLGGRPLNGHYAYDDEGQPARRAQLVKDGLLTGFLMSRAPIAAVPASNGHGRRSTGNRATGRMANLVVAASKTVPEAELRRLFKAELKRQKLPWGLWFEDVEGGNTTTSRDGPQAFQVVPKLVYKVYVDGRPDDAVRGVNIVGTPLASFTKITAAASDRGVFNGVCGAESGWVPVSASAPTLLLSELEVEKQVKDAEKPPLLPPPHHDPAEAR
ncbi:MAG: TldD protein [Elusimicrobia bacterium]|nr:MAG: TldD protein [Elusimicrobiota bacterium]